MNAEHRIVGILSAACLGLVGVTAWALATRGDGEELGSAGRVFWVAVGGDDTGSGDRDDPWSTIQHAADTARPGDTVYVAGGSYAERVEIGVSGEPGRPITFAAAEGERVVLDGSSLEVPAERSAMILIDSQRYVTIRGFEISGYRSDVSGRFPSGSSSSEPPTTSASPGTSCTTWGRHSRAGTEATRTGSRCSEPRPTIRSLGSRSSTTSWRISAWVRPRLWS